MIYGLVLSTRLLANKLSPEEEQTILEQANSPEFADSSLYAQALKPGLFLLFKAQQKPPLATPTSATSSAQSPEKSALSEISHLL